MAFKRCVVVGCGHDNAILHAESGLCVPCALTWLVSERSDRTPGREDRLRAFIAKMSLRNFSEVSS